MSLPSEGQSLLGNQILSRYLKWWHPIMSPISLRRVVITRLQMDRLGRNLGGGIPFSSCSHYCNDIIPFTMGPIGTTLKRASPSNTSAAKPFPWYLVVTANRTVNVLVLWSADIKNIHTIFMKRG